MTEIEIFTLLVEWKRRLGLGEWFIKLNYNCSKSDMILEDVSGESSYDIVNKQAIIRILDKKYYDDIVEFDFERTLVHELLHLKFAILDSISTTDLIENTIHQIIDDLSRSLVAAKRNTNCQRNQYIEVEDLGDKYDN